MSDLLSVIIPTYNPNLKRLRLALDALKQQTLHYTYWELIIIDNNSPQSFTDKIDLSWQPNHKIVTERQQGLTYARLKGFSEATGDIIIMIDDDNIANDNYLMQVQQIFKSNDNLGAIGGKSLPLFEVEPPVWINQFYGNLALRDLGDNIIIEDWQNKYPSAAPIGAGMAVRKQALSSYINKNINGRSNITDRTGSSLSSGGDNDIVLSVIKSGWQVGYYPSLVITHIIPKERLAESYLARLINNTNRSWIQVLHSHGINPWPKIPQWTVPLRKAKAWLTYKAWRNPAQKIAWQGACGTFDGLADLNRSY